MAGQRAGSYTKNLSGDAAYYSFKPNPLPPTPAIEQDEEMVALLVEAHKQLTEFESISSYIPNIDIFIYMNILKEALMSSQIEGTQATLEDILDPNIETNANRDIGEVLSYKKAVDYAKEKLNELPLGNRLIKQTHEVLMRGSRGEEKTPGEFRRSQNWIGGHGVALKDARYIPPNPREMEMAMSDLEKYINTGNELDVLIRAGLIHYQFETIHPFLDGNGRLGRLMIVLFLLEQGAISSQALYISYFLKKNRIEYYDRLNEVRNKGNFEQWIKFFLKAVIVSAKDAVDKIKLLSELHDLNIAKIEELGRARIPTRTVFEYLEKSPIIEISKTSRELGLSYNTVLGAVQRLEKLGIVAESTGKLRNRIFSYVEYLDILRDGTEY
jgi:Fic family protein